MNNNNLIFKSLLLLVFLPLLTGCWDLKEIEERATILGLAIDIIEDDEQIESITHPNSKEMPTSNLGKIKVTAQLAVPGQIPLGPSQGGGQGTSQDKVWVVEGVGNTMEDAIQHLQQQLAHKIFFGQLQVIIISEEVAKKGIDHINEYLRRRPEVRRTAWMAVNGNDAASTMQIAPKLEQVPAIYLSTMFEEAVKMGKFPENNIGNFWTHLSNKGQDGYLPYIKTKSEDNIQINGLAYFNNDKMVATTKPYQIALFNALTQQNPGGAAMTIKLSEKKSVMFQSARRKVRYEATLKEGKPHFTINLNVWGNIREKNTQKIKLDDKKTIEYIEKIAEKQSKKEIIQLIKETQENKSDIFGFGEYVRGDLSSFWDDKVETTAKWKEYYKDMTVEVKMRIHIDRVGMKAS